MGNLAIIEDKYIIQAQQQVGYYFDKGILKAMSDKRVSSFKDKNQLQPLITSVLNEVILNDLGYKIDENMHESILIKVFIDITREFSYLTVQEISIAFRNGAREKYGEYFGLNPVTFYKWLKIYCATDRNQTLQVINKANDLKELSADIPVDKVKLKKDWLNRKIAQYNKMLENNNPDFFANQFIDLNNIFYSELISLGILKVSDAKMEKYYKQAKRNIIEKKSKIPDTNIKAIIEQKEGEALIKSTAEKLILQSFINDMVKQKIDLGKLINAKK